MHSWVSGRSYSIDIDRQRLYPAGVCCLTCCTEQTIDYVTAQKMDPILQIFLILERLKALKSWDNERRKSIYSPCFQPFSHKCKGQFLLCCPKETIPFLCECIVNLPKRKQQNIKRHLVANFKQSLAALSKENNLEAKMGHFSVLKRLELIKVITPPVINHLS